jgi:two-component system, response regulator PdtaR
MRVVIADDEAIIRIGLRAMLQEAGHQVVGSVATGREALELAETAKPDLMILDIKMPELDGLETAQKIMGTRPMPIVMLTAYSQRELVEQAKAAAVFAYLVKPVKEESLGLTLELAVERFKEWKLLRQQVHDLRKSLEARDSIERAKRLLMERDGLSEREAFLTIRRRSRARRVPMQRTAEELLTKSR